MSGSESLADRIRRVSFQNFVRPALKNQTGEISIRAGDVHTAMHLRDKMPAVCGALQSGKFAALCDIKLLRRRGPHQGANAFFIFGPSGSIGGKTEVTDTVVKKDTPKISARTTQWAANNAKGTVYWVTCVKTKRSSKAPAEDLYISDWFSKARALVASTGAPWFILSAKYGLVSPNQVITPYELTLNEMLIANRRRWADEILEKFRKQIPRPTRIVMFAGARYREFLKPRLEAMGIEVDVPMEGLPFGKQLSWLGNRAQNG